MRPTAAELPALRKGLRKRTVPEVFGGMWSSQPGIGGAIFHRDGSTFRVEWVAGASEKVQPRKKAMLDELCTRPDLELERLELGYLLHDLCAHQAGQVMQSISGTNESASAATPFWKAADDWKHCGLVPAGHMKA